LGKSNAHIHFQMLFGTARAKGFARVLIAKTGELIAAMNAVAISSNGSGLNRYQGHLIFPFRQDITGASRFSQVSHGFSFPRAT
jgi:hypothetical protein